MAEDPILAAYMGECEGVAKALLEQVTEAGDHDPAIRESIIAQTAYSVGLEVGLSVAVADVAAGRRLQGWIATQIHGGDPAALSARDHQAYHFLRVLDR